MGTTLYDAPHSVLDQVTDGEITDPRPIVTTLAAANAESFIDLNGHAVAVFDLRTAAMSGTLVFEATVDGTNYFALPAFDQAIQQFIASVVVTTTLAKTYFVGVSGFRRVRVRVSAYTSGNIACALRASSSDFGIYSWPLPSTLAATVTVAANTAATLTLPAGGVGLFHYITRLEIRRTATAALAGTATLVVTTTNLPGTLAYSFGNAMGAGGTQVDLDADFQNPLKSSVANTATTIVMPAPGAAVLWRANAYYYLGA